jgi:cell division protein FtsB
VDDYLDKLNHLNLGPVLTFLLVALFGALKWIGKGIVARIEALERDIDQFRREEFETLQYLVQRHTTKIAVIKMKLGMDDDD